MKNFLKTLFMLLILFLCVWGMGKVFTPRYWEWNMDNKMKGLYKEKNSLQAVMLGTSTVGNGLSPVYLYDNYGISSYNLGSDEQPVFLSYELIKEARRLNPDSLKYVILETSYILSTEEENRGEFNHLEKALNYMPLSRTKLELLRDADAYYDGFNPISYLLPGIKYHSRWDSLTAEDLELIGTKRNVYFSRGQNLTYNVVSLKSQTRHAKIPDYTIDDEMDLSEEELQELISSYDLEMYDNIVNYCREEGLQLILIRLPSRWTDQQHDVMSYLADRDGVPFIDYNKVSIQEECGLDFLLDSEMIIHLNVSGAEKVTDYLGRYLCSNYNTIDDRENAACDFIKDQSLVYEGAVEDFELPKCDDLHEYIERLDRDRYTIFISARKDTAAGLTDEDRALLGDMGLTDLANIESGESYIGIMNGGEVIYEKRGDTILQKAGRYRYGELVPSASSKSSAYTASVTAYGEFQIQSSDSLGSIVYNGNEMSLDYNGLNIVVYNDLTAMCVDRCSFDTSSDGKRVRKPHDFSLRKYECDCLKARLEVTDSVPEIIQLADEKGIMSIYCAYSEQGEASSYFYYQGNVLSSHQAVSGQDLVTGGVDALEDYTIVYGENDQYQIRVEGTAYSIPRGMQGVLLYDPQQRSVVDFKNIVQE